MTTESGGLVLRVMRVCFARPVLAGGLVLFAAALGLSWLRALPRDVFPDLSVPIFNVIVQNPAMNAEELETGIAIPMEVALSGLPDVRRIRSTSQLGVAQITVEFDSEADYHRSRQFVAERVAQAASQMPPGTDAPLLSSLTGRLNEIFEFTLEAEAGTVDLMTLRDLAEFEVKNRLLAVPGVAAVERLGGHLRQYQVLLDPERASGARRDPRGGHPRPRRRERERRRGHRRPGLDGVDGPSGGPDLVSRRPAEHGGRVARHDARPPR